jgi:CBS domain-containing protein
MAIKDIMTKTAEYIPAQTTILEAARKMKEMDCGFLPVSDQQRNKLCGVITDRDICVRAVAEGMDPNDTTVDKVLSNKVLYCFENDNIEAAAASMREQCVYRLIVLDNKKDKNLVGIITLGDLVRSGQSSLASEASAAILSKQAA